MMEQLRGKYDLETGIFYHPMLRPKEVKVENTIVTPVVTIPKPEIKISEQPQNKVQKPKGFLNWLMG